MTYHPISFAVSAIVYPNKVNLIVYQFYKRCPFKNAQVDYKGSSLGTLCFFLIVEQFPRNLWNTLYVYTYFVTVRLMLIVN